jgi:hypothetical protein
LDSKRTPGCLAYLTLHIGDTRYRAHSKATIEAVLARSAMPGICRKSDYFYPIFQSKATLEERNLLGVKLVERGPQKHFRLRWPRLQHNLGLC